MYIKKLTKKGTSDALVIDTQLKKMLGIDESNEVIMEMYGDELRIKAHKKSKLNPSDDECLKVFNKLFNKYAKDYIDYLDKVGVIDEKAV